MSTETQLELVKAKTLCERLGITRGTLHRWLDLGLPFVPASARGRTKLYRWENVVAWIEARETSRHATPEAGVARGRKAGRPRKGAGQGKSRWAED